MTITPALPAAADPASDAVDGRDARVLAERVRFLYGGAGVTLANLVNALIVAAVLWTEIDRPLLLAWLAATALVVSSRILLAWHYRRADAADRPLRWARRFTLGAVASGLLWGALSLAVADAGSTTEFLFVAFVIAGMTAGALGSLAPHLPAYAGYLVSAVLPVAVLSLFQDEFSIGLSGLCLSYAVIMLLAARSYNRTLVKTLCLQIENAALSERLGRARDAVIEANQEKWQTLAHLSHELRTPLNAILGFSGILKSELMGPLGSAKYRDYAEHIVSGGTHVLDLVNEILVLSQAEAGRLILEEAEVDLGVAVRDCLRLVAERAAAAGITIRVETVEPLPRFRGDPIKMRQILFNLLSNAVKFTPEGGTVTVEAGSGPDGALRVAVRDTGIGMAEEDVGRALLPFVRLQNALTRKSEGTGLGLPICKRLVELHGGRFRIDSTPGAGTTVTLHFPPSRTVPATATASGAAFGPAA